MDPQGEIRPRDVLTVRECGSTLVERFRMQAIKVGWLPRPAAGRASAPAAGTGCPRCSRCCQHISLPPPTSPHLQGDATWIQRLEQEQVAGAKGAAGMERRRALRRCRRLLAACWLCSRAAR